MEPVIQHRELAAWVARVFLGLLFFRQGYDTVFRIGVKNAVASYESHFEQRGLSQVYSRIAGILTAYSELIGGVLIILGLFTTLGYCLLSLNIFIAVIGFLIIHPLPDLTHIFPRLGLLLFVLSLPADWDRYQMDKLLLTITSQ